MSILPQRNLAKVIATRFAGGRKKLSYFAGWWEYKLIKSFWRGIW